MSGMCRDLLEQFQHREWVQVPWWHPQYWAGARMRRWCWDAYSIGGEYDGQWEYATFEKCARQTLEELYGK